MKKKFFVRLAGIGMLGLLIAGCSNVPQPEIDAAKLAIERADSLGAEEYLPLEFRTIQDSLQSVLTTVNEADSKFIKNFGSSKEKLVEITTLATDLQTKTTEKKAAVKSETEAMISEADTLISSSYLLITQAPKGKEGTTALTAIRAELDALKVSMTEVNVSMSNGNYMDAQNKVAVIKEKAGAVYNELSSVIEKYKSNRR